jgi:hypothetical protein
MSCVEGRYGTAVGVRKRMRAKEMVEVFLQEALAAALGVGDVHA